TLSRHRLAQLHQRTIRKTSRSRHTCHASRADRSPLDLAARPVTTPVPTPDETASRPPRSLLAKLGNAGSPEEPSASPPPGCLSRTKPAQETSLPFTSCAPPWSGGLQCCDHRLEQRDELR